VLRKGGVVAREEQAFVFGLNFGVWNLKALLWVFRPGALQVIVVIVPSTSAPKCQSSRISDPCPHSLHLHPAVFSFPLAAERSLVVSDVDSVHPLYHRKHQRYPGVAMVAFVSSLLAVTSSLKLALGQKQMFSSLGERGRRVCKKSPTGWVPRCSAGET
jgi:hypothetical protein